MKWGLVQTLAAIAARLQFTYLQTFLTESVCFTSTAHLCHWHINRCREEGDKLKVSVNRASTIAENTVASKERDEGTGCRGRGHPNSSVGVVSRIWTG